MEVTKKVLNHVSFFLFLKQGRDRDFNHASKVNWRDPKATPHAHQQSGHYSNERGHSLFMSFLEHCTTSTQTTALYMSSHSSAGDAGSKDKTSEDKERKLGRRRWTTDVPRSHEGGVKSEARVGNEEAEHERKTVQFEMSSVVRWCGKPLTRHAKLSWTCKICRSETTHPT